MRRISIFFRPMTTEGNRGGRARESSLSNEARPRHNQRRRRKGPQWQNKMAGKKRHRADAVTRSCSVAFPEEQPVWQSAQNKRNRSKAAFTRADLLWGHYKKARVRKYACNERKCRANKRGEPHSTDAMQTLVRNRINGKPHSTVSEIENRETKRGRAIAPRFSQ